MSASGDIDPHRLHADPPRKRRRRKRTKPNPLVSQKSAEAETVERLKALPLTPGVMLEREDGEWLATAPHNDPELWLAQMAVAFGTRSMALVHTFADQLRELCPQDWDETAKAWKTNEREWNALLALVADHQPANASQAALAAQMAAVHLMQMRLSKDALNSGGMVIERSAALAGKLARTYAMQCDTMQALKGRKTASRQTIKVEKTLTQEVHYHDHRTGGAGQSVAQPQDARAATIEGRASLPSPRQVNGEVLPLRRDEGQAGLQEAWRGQPRRSEG